MPTPVSNSLLNEKDITIWSEAHVTEALTELQALMHLDREAALLKISCLYGMAKSEYKAHFDARFDPKAPKAANHPAPGFFGKKVESHCVRIFNSLHQLGLATTP